MFQEQEEVISWLLMKKDLVQLNNSHFIPLILTMFHTIMKDRAQVNMKLFQKQALEERAVSLRISMHKLRLFREEQTFREHVNHVDQQVGVIIVLKVNLNNS